jgi:hypothetical protein
MVTNLNAARTLIQADLDHARNVLELWNHQVGDLEKALEQIDAVGNSRSFQVKWIRSTISLPGGRGWPWTQRRTGYLWRLSRNSVRSKSLTWRRNFVLRRMAGLWTA